MNITQILLQTVTDAKVGFIISAIIGYSLYKIIAVINRKKLQSSNDNCNETLNYMQMYADNYKLVLVIRTDLKMGKGKIAAQCAHAAVAAYKAATKYPEFLYAWEKCGQAKITLKVDSENALKEIAKQARTVGLLANIIQDAGHTQVKPGSKTVCAIGPGPAQMIDNVTGHLKLF
ncbi:peptidyl-tRNA hydrolase 2, mitochondrial-like [Bombus vosnesenskii]|uniref:peptidyl-tRNA hydrolase n=3 Tax=Pyrobombus TaxID=144703 RepID=A0A6J3KZ29_9HYME|nr:peptidyl-tRNA hydrolase 2, mitochondrial isoform X1 [Bombus impatiens]XP_033192521.1 peptidyl-tRNA hydrolase 2, mitochondrial-like [Bombus vancouverensis nearcticus]XP_033192522.1 peptidyl-tRNA hydrolase 2, mitochondrial-like [Bombus vancouverensis nearcticus]XP_033309396.1 peptidyl-tRNA hydrolase 2, mitochondrial-like [Bombus bifarius]XP_033358221.1 peptidyl-tRNA hydrolase 2, mitochondrial-like [Bombus vosnesenskii]XP_033358222.1 peptidyl-tRNA hydrolase 2, mitochondrial-like [Bombus vosnes